MPCEVEMEDERPETETIFFIVECAAFAYSVLRNWGERLHLPIAVLVDRPERLDVIASSLGIFQTRVVSTNMSPIEFQKALAGYHDDVCVLYYMTGRYTPGNMEKLLNLVMCGGPETVEMGMPVMVFQKAIPKEYQDKFSLAVQMDERELGGLNSRDVDVFLEKLKTYILTKAQILEHEIGRQSEFGHEGRDSDFWTAVIKMIELVSAQEEKAGKDGICEALRTALQKAYAAAEAYGFNQQIPALFREALEKAIPEVCRFQPETKAAGLSEHDLSDTVLYDSRHYYIPESLFVKICKPLSEVCTVNQIKAVLAEEGILCTQGQGRLYRTIKKKVGSSSTPTRFVWLKRDTLEGGMEMSFEEIYRIRRGTDG